MYIFAYLYCEAGLIESPLNYWFVEPPKLLPCPAGVCKFALKDKYETIGFEENISLTITITISILEIKPLPFVELSNDFSSGNPIPDCPTNVSFICQSLPTAAL